MSCILLIYVRKRSIQDYNYDNTAVCALHGGYVGLTSLLFLCAQLFPCGIRVGMFASMFVKEAVSFKQ